MACWMPRVDSRRAALAEEHRAARHSAALPALLAGAQRLEQPVAHEEVVAQRALRMVADGHDALLAPLAAHLDLLRHEVEIAEIHAAQLGEPQPAGVEQLEHGEVAHVAEVAGLGARGRMLQQRVGLPAVEVRRQRARQARRTHGARRVHVDALVAMHPAIEAAHRRQRTGDGPLGEPASRAVRHEAANLGASERVPVPAGDALRGREIAAEVAQVAPVGGNRVGRQVTLLGEVREILVDLDGEWRLVGPFRRRAVHPRRTLQRTEQPRARHASAVIAARPRSANAARLRALSRSSSCDAFSSSSSKPKLAFIGWKCFGSASRR